MKALIVDDEPRARENLRILLTDYCQVEDFSEVASAHEALKLIKEQKPDVLFLDVQMPGMNGIELAGKVQDQRIPVIFVTAYDHYALQALKASAVDYLLKPAKIKELQQAVEKVRSAVTPAPHQKEAIETLNSNLDAKNGLEKLMVPWDGGFKIVDLSNVSHIVSDNTYCELTVDGDRVVVSRSIGDFEGMLQDSGFYRVHYQHMVNLAFLDTFSSKDGGQVVLKTGAKVPISRRRLAGFRDAASVYFNKE